MERKQYRPGAFVLGAGASMPYGFPSGEQLVQRIIDAMHKSHPDTDALFAPEFSLDARKEFGEALLRSRRWSIDTFLEHNPEFENIGKRAIAHQLIQCEVPDNVFQPPKDVIGRTAGGDWCRYFLNTFLLDGSPEDFAASRLLMLTFNYDRSFEFCLFNALKYSYHLSDADAQKLLTEGVRILHLHGDLGALFESDGGPDNHRRFLPTLTKQTIETAQRRLRVVHDDSTEALANYNAANEALIEYEIVCFLGFSYNETSLKRLSAALVRAMHGERRDRPIILWGTTLGMAPNDFPRIDAALGRGLGWHRQADCLEFLQEARWFDPGAG